MKQPTPPCRAQKITLSGKAHRPRIVRLAGKQASLHVRCMHGSISTLFIDGSAPAADQRDDVRHVLIFDLAPRAVLTVVFVWRGPGPAHIEQRATVAAEAVFHLLNVTEGSTEQSFAADVKGAGGTCTLDWIARVRGSERSILSARTVFASRNGRGETTLHGVAEDKAHLKISGLIAIPHSGTGTQTRLTQKILLLDPQARAEAIPELKIETNDVQAGHSASVSRIHPEDIFYLQSRGITPKKARAMLIEGFLKELIERVEDEELKRMMRTKRIIHSSSPSSLTHASGTGNKTRQR